ncbi:hypothetical protein vseg_018289 [Gypsophila vaccaria]
MILILGRLRARGNSSMKLVSTKSFVITGYLITYISGLMSSPSESNDLYIFWAAFIAYLAAVTNEISCFTLGDNEDHKKRLIVEFFVVWPLILTSLYKSLAAPEIIVPIVLIFCVVVLKLRERSRALMYATSSSNGFARATKVICDFVEYEKERGAAQIESYSRSSYYNNFLLGIREAQSTAAKYAEMKSKFKSASMDSFPENTQFISLHKIMQSEESFLMSSTAVDKDLRNTCISFAMFSTLLAKMAGFDIVNAVIFKGDNNELLKDDPFRLIEKELEFLYDFLFTNNYAIYVRGLWKKLRNLCVIVLFVWLTIPLFVQYQPRDHNVLYVILWGRVLDTGFTRCVILAIVIIECSKICVFLTSKWAKVMYTCAYLQNETPSRTGKHTQWLIRLAFLVSRPRLSFFCLKKITARKIGQYSIMDCYDEIPPEMWAKCWIGSYFDLPRIGQAGSTYKILRPKLKDFILAICLDAKYEQQFSNGVCTLEANGLNDDLIRDYVKNLASQARVILIWHIATCGLEKDALEGSLSIKKDNHFEAATTISKYCAYLVAFVPQMLPDRVYTAQCEFDQAVKELEVQKFNEAAKEHETEKLKKAEEDPEGGPNQSKYILKQANKLKEQLDNQDDLWRILAEFWTEMLLFLALSDHGEAIEAHADNLCTGGEFITHLWALVTHSGCSRKAT